MRHNGIPFDGLIYGDDKYRQLATAIQPARVHMILDDLPEQAELASDWFASHTPYVLSRPHNEYYRRRKLHGYEEALEVLQIRSKTWQVS